MRALVIGSILIAIVATATVSCSDESCDGVPLHPGTEVAAERALSCAPAVNWEGEVYRPMCVGVPEALVELAPPLRAEGVMAGTITGVDPGDALAVRYDVDLTGLTKRQREDMRRSLRECGVWQLAPSGLSEVEVDELIAQVGIPRTAKGELH